MVEAMHAPYQESELLRREAAGDAIVWQLIAEREKLVDEMVQRGGVLPSDTLARDLRDLQAQVAHTKGEHDIVEPEPLPVETE